MEKNIFFIEGELVGVLTTEPINRFLDYYAPIGGVSVGDFVEVNLGHGKSLDVSGQKEAVNTIVQKSNK